MISRAVPVPEAEPAGPITSALPAPDQVRHRLEAAMSRRELLKRSLVLTAAGATTMALKIAPLTHTPSASGTAAATVSGAALLPEYARFMEMVGASFTATAPGQRATLTLEEVILLGDANDTGRPAGLRDTPYALRFVVSDGELAPSGMFQLADARHQPMDIFIHQVGMRASGGDIRYEAVFN